MAQRAIFVDRSGRRRIVMRRVGLVLALASMATARHPPRRTGSRVFQHLPDAAAADPDALGLLVLLAVPSGASLVGIVGTRWRDVTTK